MDAPDSSSMFLHWGFHDLSLFSYLPDSDFSFGASWYDSLAVGCGGNGGNSVDMGITDTVHELSGLG